MGFFSKLKASGAYEKVLAARGIDARSIPASLHSTICGYANQQHERINFGGSMDLIATVSNAAEHSCCCMLGPTRYRQAGGYKEFAEIKRIADDWKSNGSEFSCETMIVRSINDAGLLHPEYAQIFKSHL